MRGGHAPSLSGVGELWAHEGHMHVMGTVTAVNDGRLVVHTRDGQAGPHEGTSMGKGGRGKHSPVTPAARRKLWLAVHGYIGLFAGTLLIFIALTGSILVFWQEIDAWLNPELFRVQAPMQDARPIGL